MTTELSLDVTPTGWQPSGSLTFDEWEQVGNTLLAIDKSINWWIGDWLVYGEAKWGEMYAQAEAITGWNYDRLARAKWVASNVPFWLRNQNLSWTCHLAVAPLPTEEQQRWLQEAEKQGLHSAELRQAINKAASLPPIVPPTPLEIGYGANGDDDGDDVPYSGSGPDNYDDDAPVSVVEYEQAEERWHDDDLPTLSWETMAEVQALVTATLLHRHDEAFDLAVKLEGKVMR